MHQLDEDSRRLDADRFRERTIELLEAGQDCQP